MTVTAQKPGGEIRAIRGGYGVSRHQCPVEMMGKWSLCFDLRGLNAPGTQHSVMASNSKSKSQVYHTA
jgi:hypothetical protein